MNEIERTQDNNPALAYEELSGQYLRAYQLVDDIVLKNYISKLSTMELVPLDESIKKANASDNVRFFKITEMVYQKDEYATYKFATVFNSVSNLECSVFIIIDSDGDKTEFYLGIRSLNSRRTTNSLKETLKNSLLGQFPGVKTQDFMEKDMLEFLERIDGSSIAVASCVAKNKDEDITENRTFLQGLEKLAVSMQGQRYTGVIIANGATSEQLQLVKKGYENIYTQLSPFAEMQINFGENEAISISETFSVADTKGTSYSKNFSETKGTSDTYTINESVTEKSKLAKGLGAVAAVAPIIGGLLALPTGGASLAVAGVLSGTAGIAGSLLDKSETKGMSDAHTTNESETTGETFTDNESKTKTETDTKGLTTGKSRNLQLTRKNKTISDMLERLDLQLKRIKEFESLGMWECAAYFLSANQYSAEIAASTYKALMRGEDSGVEMSAVNTWGVQSGGKIEVLKDYIKNFIHPVFAYQTGNSFVPINACSFVSGNELAIHIGLPRKSVAGFPVIEHAEFGKDVLRYNNAVNLGDIKLGKIYDMGIEQKQDVLLSRRSLTMHTFITGSTGSGKSNTVYRILDQLDAYDIPFLVIESAKGEYKHAFCGKKNVSVYGTNPELGDLLKINPFNFSKGIHILEHLDRLIEIFNVCWPMYAAMPAVLKEAVEKSYSDTGWDLQTSKNRYAENLFPSFADVSGNILSVINDSEYSEENKGNYKGALVTRINSLTNGLNGMIFVNDDLPNETLFDKSVIVDLSRVGSIETKALIMGLLVMKLQEYRATSSEDMDLPLRHVTVLEEAHNLLKRTSTEQTSEGANLLGKSVEMLANAIAEMRTYGEGFIIADQSPGLLDMSVIRNTNTKIILRLPDESDRQLVGKAASLNDDQIIELAKLQQGVAAVYQNDWIQPVLCKVKKFDKPEEQYKVPANVVFTDSGNSEETAALKKRMTAYLLSNLYSPVKEPGDKEVAELQAEVLKSSLCSVVKARFFDFVSRYAPPTSLEPVYDIIGGLYSCPQKVFEKLVPDAKPSLDWAKLFHDEITPSINDFDWQTQKAIMQCVALSLENRNSRLKYLPLGLKQVI
jgi:DNA helicase HerA-like ATPase